MNNSDNTAASKSAESSRYGLGALRWSLLIIAFVFGTACAYSLDKVVTVLSLGPSSAVAAPDNGADPYSRK
ncbi:MAG: hypothetical protein LBQ54_00695 [Planctomycetaceae bacterium]|nr:hypothetical protein [Planctomycetaceae bacterium]